VPSHPKDPLSSPEPLIQVGSKLNDYEVVARLRSGGMAALYLGRRMGAAGFSRPVAIKVVHPHLSEDKNFTTMFVDEAKLSARIVHPNVVHVEELGQRGTLYYLVMEYVHGCSLSQLIRALRARRRRFTPEMAAYIAIQTAEGLHAAHETIGDDGELLNVVHRDISPQNVLFSYRGHTKLIDFGVAKARGRSQHTTVASLKGKLRYMAPEQASSQHVDRRTDVYALGIVLWEMLTMRTLFKAENDLRLHDLVKNPVVEPPSKYVEGLPPALDALIMRTLSKDPAQRPASALDFRRQLVQAVPGALAIDSDQLADLLRTVMVDTIREQHRKLPETISRALKSEVGDALDRAQPALDDESPEAIATLTASALHISGSDAEPLDSPGSHSAVDVDDDGLVGGDEAVWGAAPESHTQQAEEVRAQKAWVRWVALAVVFGAVALAIWTISSSAIDDSAQSPVAGPAAERSPSGEPAAGDTTGTAVAPAAPVNEPTQVAGAVPVDNAAPVAATPPPANGSDAAPAADARGATKRVQNTRTRNRPATGGGAAEEEPAAEEQRPIVNSEDLLDEGSSPRTAPAKKRAAPEPEGSAGDSLDIIN
jgi:serine/threonine protein kinase